MLGGSLGSFLGAVEGSWEPLGGFWDPLGAHLGTLEGQAVISVILEADGRILGPLGALSKPLGEVLGAS